MLFAQTGERMRMHPINNTVQYIFGYRAPGRYIAEIRKNTKEPNRPRCGLRIATAQFRKTPTHHALAHPRYANYSAPSRVEKSWSAYSGGKIGLTLLQYSNWLPGRI